MGEVPRGFGNRRVDPGQGGGVRFLERISAAGRMTRPTTPAPPVAVTAATSCPPCAETR
jgi:hypothetical protein